MEKVHSVERRSTIWSNPPGGTFEYFGRVYCPQYGVTKSDSQGLRVLQLVFTRTEERTRGTIARKIPLWISDILTDDPLKFDARLLMYDERHANYVKRGETVRIPDDYKTIDEVYLGVSR